MDHDSTDYVPWQCLRCGKGSDGTIKARRRTMIQCTCGATSWPHEALTAPCGDVLDFDETWFTCTLPTGHHGSHRNHCPDAHRGMTIEWNQQPTTIPGEVI